MLADGTRVWLLWAMIDGEVPVNELASRVGKPATSASQHPAKLRMARRVHTRREGMQVVYRWRTTTWVSTSRCRPQRRARRRRSAGHHLDEEQLTAVRHG